MRPLDARGGGAHLGTGGPSRRPPAAGCAGVNTGVPGPGRGSRSVPGARSGWPGLLILRAAGGRMKQWKAG